MQNPDLNLHDSSTIPSESDPLEDGALVDGLEHVIEEGSHRRLDETDLPDGDGITGQLSGEFEGAADDPERTLELGPPACTAHLSRGHTRYDRGDPQCESDYRTAFFLNAGQAASGIVRRLENDIRRDVSHVLLTCRGRLRINPQDVVARTRLGLTLLMVLQENEASHELRQVFLHSPVWRPFLRLLVNQARQRRVTIFARILRRP